MFLLAFGIALSFLRGGTTGKLKGRVTDPEGESLPGANVIVEGTSLGAAADNRGEYYILNLPPGPHTVSFSMIGYTTLNVEEVRIRSDLTTVLDANLEETVLEAAEEITVVARRPMIQKDATASASVISTDIIEDSPIETFQDIVQIKAGVSVDAGGALHFRGGRSDEITFLVDGVPNVNPYHNGLNVDIATNAIQELSVITGAFSAEYGQAMSGVINIVTKDPLNRFQGSLSYMGGDLLSGYHIDIDSRIRDEARSFRPGSQSEIEAVLSGPVLFMDRLRFFSSLRRVTSEGNLYGLSRYTPYGVEKDSAEWSPFPLDPYQKTILQAKLSYTPRGQIKLRYSVLLEDNYWRSYSHSRKYLTEGHYENLKFAVSHMLQLTHQLSTKHFYTLSYSRVNNNYEYFSYPSYWERFTDTNGNGTWDVGEALNDDTGADGQRGTGDDGEGNGLPDPGEPDYSSVDKYVWDGYYLSDSNYEFYTGGTNNGRYDRKVSTDLIIGQLVSQIRKQHEIKFGFEAKRHTISLHEWNLLVDRRDEPWEDSDGDGVYDPGEEFTDLNGDGEWNAAKDDNNDGFYGNIVVPEPGPNNISYTKTPTEISAYLQDKIELRDLVMNVGIRWDYYDPEGHVATDWNDPDPEKTRPAEPKQQLSPRFSIAYPITDRGKLFFSYGHFFQMPPYFRLYDNPDFAVLPGVIKSDIGNADLDPQKTVNYEVGFEQEVSTDAAIYLKAFYRDMRNLLGQRVYILPGGSDSYALFINRDWGNVKGVTFSFDQRFARLISGSIDYTYQVAVGNESDPTRTRRDYRLSVEAQRKVVFLDWDQTHTFRFNLNIGRPDDWRVSTIGIVESGYPYTPKDVNELVRIAEENSGRKPPRFNVDLHAYKTVRIPAGQPVVSPRLFLKIYNLLDRRNENYVWDSSGRAGYSLGRYGGWSSPEWVNRPNWYSTPREIYFGLSLSFR